MPIKVRRKKIRIKPSRTARKSANDDHYGMKAWEKSWPFAANRRGVLTHRVRHVCTIIHRGRASHHHVEYLCGNGCNVDLDSADDTFVADPPKDRLLCLRCEQVAEQKSLPSGDQLAGRHVHVGVLVPTQTCCKE